MSEQTLQKNNPMRQIKIAKVTVNIGLGESGERLQKAFQLLEELTNAKPVYTKAKKSIKEFDVRKGAPIGVMVTLRGQKAEDFLKKVLAAVNYKIKSSSFDRHGNVSFGIAEHVIIPGTRYDPEVGIFGLDVAITFERPGFRISKRKRKKSRIPDSARVRKEESAKFLADKFGVVIV
ncbi:50S ribosomal protein L5 [Metallosphaera tengchongensis]|uniref:Large ribosomal subunit protein uL5 n=1 Tax=Metallosphaera tengchongensis TaxID=1532350 RepID=A0A6N0NSW4_9CREN|nr:50S ribosomal protein L5 [Metallosphaera tengchongensis]QKQ99933.1 50S ribosomal protein L5 [Metallosphaera tengchongensis]